MKESATSLARAGYITIFKYTAGVSTLNIEAYFLLFFVYINCLLVFPY